MWTKNDNKSNLKKRKGISLITLIITIVVAIILTVVIIMVSTKENAIGSARANKVLSNRDTIESEIKMYVSNVQSDTRGYFTTLQIISGAAKQRETENKFLKDGTIKYRIVACESVVAGVNDEEVSEKQIYKLDSEKYKEKTGHDLPAAPNSHSAWYVDGNGTVYVAFDSKDNIPKSLKSGSDETMLVDNSLLNTYTVITDLEVCEEFDDTPIDPDKDKDDDEKQDDIIIPDTTEYGWFTWTVSNGQVTITGFNETKISEEGYYPTTVVFPKTIQGNPVVAINGWSFYGRNKIEKLYVSEGIKTVGDGAFQYCSGLTEVYLPSTLENISNSTSSGYAPFYSCNSIKKIMIPQSVVNSSRSASSIFYNSRTGINQVLFVGDITSIGNDAFDYMTSLNNIVIPKTTVSIGSCAFRNCSSLPRISVPNSVVSIGDWAFQYCYGATELKLGNGLKTIESGAFYSCSQLPVIKIPEGTTKIGDCAFQYCTALTEVYLPSTLSSITNSTSSGYAPFYECRNITKITVPQYVIDGSRSASSIFTYSRGKINHVEFSGTITNIGAYAFDGFTGLENISNKTVLIPSTVTSIGAYAFRNCSSVSSIEVPDFVTSIGDWAFQNCSNATVLKLGKKLEKIESGAFYNCSKLPNLIVPEGVTKIGDCAFQYCNALTDVYLPSTLSNITNSTSSGYAPFYECRNITKITVPQYVIDGNRSASSIFTYSRGKIKQVDFSGTIKYIGTYAFDGFTGLENISSKTVLIPSTVTSIGAYAFRNCSSVSSIEVPDFVTIIGDWAFQNCSNSSKLTLGTGLKNIESGAFYNCSKLPNLIVPEGVTKIGDCAFQYCNALTEVYLPSTLSNITNSTSSGYAPFYECRNITKITVPQYVIDGNRSASSIFTYSKGNIKQVDFSGTIKYIGSYAFDGFTGLENISSKTVLIPSTVTSIGAYAFRNCSSVSSIEVPDFVTIIGDWAFQNCSNATVLKLGKKLEKIESGAFYNCSKLPNLIVPEGVTKIGDCAFQYCNALTEVHLPSTLSSISNSTSSGYAPFYECRNITKITVPQYVIDGSRSASSIFNYSKNKIENVEFSGNVTFIGAYAFDGFTGFKNISEDTVVIPSTVTSIGNYAFRNCSSVSSIEVPDFVTSIGDWAFQNCYSMTTLNLGKGLQYIGAGAFQNCSSIPNLIVPEGVKTIGDCAFQYCNALTEVRLPSTLSNISNSTSSGYAPFYECRNITKITVPQYVIDGNRSASNIFYYSRGKINQVDFSGTINYIGSYAFDNFTGLENISSETVLIPETVTYIGDNAFRNCSLVSSIEIPDFVTSIGDWAFQSCSSAIKLNLGTGLQTIGNGAFQNCSKLPNLIVPEGVTKIGDCAFQYCNALTDVYLPSTLSNITNSTSSGYAPFYECRNITKITVPQYVIDGNRSASNIFYYSRGKINQVDFSGTINYIGSYAFDNFTGLENISSETVLIPETVTYIGDNAFRNCSLVSSIEIPDFVTSIGDWAFQSCSSAIKLNLGTGLQTIGNGAFQNCSKLPNLIVPEGVTKIGDCAFQYCNALTDVYLPSTLSNITNSTSSGYAPFYECRNITKITVPQYVTGNNDITNIFYYSRGKIKDIYLDSNVTSITSNGLSEFSDVTLHFKGSIPSGAPWGGSNVKTVQE